MKKRFTVIIGVFLVFAAVLTGCSGDTKQNYVDKGQGETPSDPFVRVEGEYFVQNRATDYVVVIENNPDTVISTAAEELQFFFQEATGLTLQIKQDKETDGSERKMISLGSTSYARLALGATGAELELGEYRIATEQQNVYVLGGTSEGVAAGVYRLLEYMFHYEFFKEGIYTLDRNVTELNFFQVDVTETPAIPYIADYSGMHLWGSKIASARLNMTQDGRLAVGEHHNANRSVFPETKYNDPSDPANYHPKWFAVGADQLCYTAQGDAAELDAMVDAASDYFVDLLLQKDNLSKTYARFQMWDDKAWCACESCKAAKELYGSESGAMLVVSNRIGKATTEKLHALGDDRTIRIVTMLYLATENVPVYRNGEGNWVLDEDVGTLEYVCPLWACITRSHDRPWSHPENAAALEMLNQMNAAFEHFWLWDYGINFNDYLLPFDTFNCLAEDAKLLSNYNIDLYLYQLANDAYNVTGFNSLKVYLYSHLFRNPDLDVEELTRKYFDNVYGAGGDLMREVYEEYRLLSIRNNTSTATDAEWDQSIYSGSMIDEKYWPEALLRSWLGKIDRALELSGNDGVYQIGTIAANSKEQIERNILTDGIFVRYIYSCLYLTDNTDENVTFKVALYNDFVALDFERPRENGSKWDLHVKLDITKYVV